MRRIIRISLAIHFALATLWLMPGHEAHADKDEASLHAHVQFGSAKMGIREAPGQTDSAPFVGVGARATYATSNWYAYEASVWAGHLTDPVWYTMDTNRGKELWGWHMDWARVELSITARFGVRIIPTLHAALGMQTRLAWKGRVAELTFIDEPYQRARPGWRLAIEPVGSLGAGLDYRLGDHWIMGVAVNVQRSVLAEATFQAIAPTFHVSYYFYPEGAGP
jgi:hypothetical protein